MTSKSKTRVVVNEDISGSELSESDMEDTQLDIMPEEMECDRNAESYDEDDECDDSNVVKNHPQNRKWAKMMSKVLHCEVTDKKNFILSKARRDSEVKPKAAAVKKKEVEIVDESGKVIKEEIEPVESKMSIKRERKKLLKKQHDKLVWETMCRKKPDITCKEKDRELMKIATRGVVHLFNTVEKYQQSLKKSQETKDSEVKLTKGNFIDILKSGAKGNQKIEASSKQEPSETWSVLRDDYMMGADRKDWDKESDDEM